MFAITRARFLIVLLGVCVGVDVRCVQLTCRPGTCARHLRPLSAGHVCSHHKEKKQLFLLVPTVAQSCVPMFC